jgi:hypothetical protein
MPWSSLEAQAGLRCHSCRATLSLQHVHLGTCRYTKRAVRDDGGFKLDTLQWLQKQQWSARRYGEAVRPLLSELQVPEWQELTVDRRKWRNMLKSIDIVYYLVLQAQEVGLCAQRYRVDQPRTRSDRRATPGGSLHHKQEAGPSGLGVVGGGELANSAAALPSEGRPPSTRQNTRASRRCLRDCNKQ